MAQSKQYNPREVAVEILKKTEELLKKSEVIKKYESENSKKLGYKPFPVKEFQPEKTDKAYNVESGKSKGEDRTKKQSAPCNNPKEQKEGNNKPGGTVLKDAEKVSMDKSEKLKKDGFPTLTNVPKTVSPPVASGISGAFGSVGKSEGAESKHDRCVEHVKENSPEVKNPHAVCVAEGVRPAKWSKAEGEHLGVAKLAKFMDSYSAKKVKKGY